MKTNSNRMAALALAAAFSGTALAQTINVNVNGQPVMFSGVTPQQMNGRVLVPLRGVLEQLGAYVGWEASTRTVTANKSGVDLSLRLGDRRAVVNGREVMLDVPAQEYRGSTLVPLRFVGEALGAEVKWDAATYTVNITTADNTRNQGTTDPNQYVPPTGNNNTGNRTVAITSFDADHSGIIRGGTELRFTMVGTPGGQASFSVPGLVDEVMMREVSPGTYQGTYTVPVGTRVNITRANAVGRLRVGGVDKLIQSTGNFGFDTSAPVISTFTPEEGTRVNRRRPNISATFDDMSGSGIDPASVVVRVDGRDVTLDARPTETGFSYRPNQTMSAGRHTVDVRARDRAGNEVNRSWTFEVVGGTGNGTTSNDVIRSFTSNATTDLSPGTDVTFTMVGEAGGQASFSIGDRVINRPMTEVSPGRYEGTYTIRRNDAFQNMIATGRLVTRNGETFTTESNNGLNYNPSTLEAPRFTSPTTNDTIGNQVVLTGTAAPGSRIHIKVDYSKTVLGAFRTNGTVSEFEVTADDRGRFETDQIDLNTGLIPGGSTTYTITAYTVGSNGRKSSETKLTLKR